MLKITKLEYQTVRPHWTFVKIHTDEGLVGYGEPVVEGRARTVLAAVRELEDWLIGRDPRHIEDLWQRMYRGSFYRGGPILVSAISGVEQALWDIFGKSVGLPVYQLLGGPTRTRIRMYAHCFGETQEQTVAKAKELVGRGFTAMKTGFFWKAVRIVDTPAFVDRAVAQIAAMREAVGNEIDIAVELHGRFSPAMAIRLCKELEPLRPLWVEEPCLPENVDTMVTIARSTTIPIATGERLYTKWGFRDAIEKQVAQIYQPDLSHAGGLSEVKKIAAMAECYYAGIAPHCPIGPVALAACLHLDASIPNFVIQEHVTLGEGVLKQPFVIKDGYIDLPTGPGLGVELDEEGLKEQEIEPDWHLPIFRHDDDGSVGDL